MKNPPPFGDGGFFTFFIYSIANEFTSAGVVAFVV